MSPADALLWLLVIAVALTILFVATAVVFGIVEDVRKQRGNR